MNIEQQVLTELINLKQLFFVLAVLGFITGLIVGIIAGMVYEDTTDTLKIRDRRRNTINDGRTNP